MTTEYNSSSSTREHNKTDNVRVKFSAILAASHHFTERSAFAAIWCRWQKLKRIKSSCKFLDFNQTFISAKYLHERLYYKSLRKSFEGEPSWYMLTDGKTDTTKNITNLTGAWREYAKAPKSRSQAIKKRERLTNFLINVFKNPGKGTDTVKTFLYPHL